jgi:hypothetical protein
MKGLNYKSRYQFISILYDLLLFFINSIMLFPSHVKRIIFCFVYSDHHHSSFIYPYLEEEILQPPYVVDVDPISYWLWSLIIFLIQRSLLSAMFIPHEVFTPQKYVHSSTWGSAEGGYPLCGVRGVHPPSWGVWGQAGPQRGFGGSVPRWGFRGEALEAKIAL